MKPQIHTNSLDMELIKRTQKSAKVEIKIHVGDEVPKLPAKVQEHPKLEEAKEPQGELDLCHHFMGIWHTWKT